jgi:F-type H+-transporting ATPase subunit delta
MTETMNNPPDIPETKQTGDVRAQRIAKVYAEALFEAASKAGQLETVIDELDSLINDVLTKDPRFGVLLSSAAIGRDARAGVIAKAFSERLSPTLYSFLQVLNSHERLELLQSVLHALRDMDNERKRRVQVFVTSAVPLSEASLGKIGDVIRARMQLEPILSPIVDPSVLGGVKIRVGDRQYDATVKTRIENIRNQILTSSSHEIQSRRDRFSSAN